MDSMNGIDWIQTALAVMFLTGLACGVLACSVIFSVALWMARRVK